MKQLLNGVFGNSIFQFFKNGCTLKNINNSSIELRNSTDTGYANISVAEPTSNTHCATKFYVDGHTGSIPEIVHPLSQIEATYNSISDVKNKIFFEYQPIVELTENTSLDLANINELTITGDTFPLAGHTWFFGLSVLSTKTGVGNGIVTLTRTTNKKLTVTCSISNPDFSGLSGKCFLVANITTTPMVDFFGNFRDITSASGYELTVDSVSGNEITFIEDLPNTFDVLGGSLTIIPNLHITNTMIINKEIKKIKFIGLCFDEGIINQNNNVFFENCAFYNTTGNCITNVNGNITFEEKENTVCLYEEGILNKHSSKIFGYLNIVFQPIFAIYTQSEKYGIWSLDQSLIDCVFTLSFSGYGILNENSTLKCQNSTFLYTYTDSVWSRVNAPAYLQGCFSNTTWFQKFYSHRTSDVFVFNASVPNVAEYNSTKITANEYNT